MTIINIESFIDTLSGEVGGDAQLIAIASRARTVGPRVTMPDPIVVRLTAGVVAAPVVLLPSGVDWYWLLSLSFFSGGGTVHRNVTVPDVVSVDWGALVDVDPATMDPLPPTVLAAWTVALGEAQASAAAAAASLASMGKGAANGVASLDAAALLPEAQVPTRLTAAVQSATFVPIASPTPPLSPSIGQQWYSSALKHLRTPANLAERRVVFSTTGSWEGQALQEPSLWIANGLYNALFTAGSGLGYASCPRTADPTVAANWSRPATYTAPVFAGAKHSSIYIEGSTIHLYYIDQATSTHVMHATASITDPLTWSAGVQVMTLPAGASLFGNTRVVLEAGVYYMVIEYKVAATGRWQMGQASTTTPDGTWTLIVGAELLDTLWPDGDRQNAGGAWLAKENSEWVMYYHSASNWNGGLPSEIFRATAPSLGANNWTLTDNREAIVRRMAAHEVDQVADVEVIRTPEGIAYAFWVGMHNRGASFVGAIAGAVLRPVMMQWNGTDWVPIDSAPGTGRAITEALKPRTVHLAANWTSSTTGAWEDLTGVSITHSNNGPDLEIEFRAIVSASGSSGYRYLFQVVQGSTVLPIGMIAGTVGIPALVVGVAKFTQLPIGLSKPFKIQVNVPTGGGTINCRPILFPEREYAVIKATEVAYP